jgi:hypothetical protein
VQCWHEEYKMRPSFTTSACRPFSCSGVAPVLEHLERLAYLEACLARPDERLAHLDDHPGGNALLSAIPTLSMTEA